MSYADLNPIRAKIADRTEESDFTSIHAHIRHYQELLDQTGNRVKAATMAPEHLLAFIGVEHQDKATGLIFSLPDHPTLIERAGRDIRDDKSDAIPHQYQSLLGDINMT
jgi:hypothetical protein